MRGMETLRMLGSLVRDIPTFLAYKADRFVLDTHAAEDLGDPDAPHMVCMSLAHKDRPVEWPCSDWLEASDRLWANPFWLTDERREP